MLLYFAESLNTYSATAIVQASPEMIRDCRDRSIFGGVVEVIWKNYTNPFRFANLYAHV